MCKQQLPPIYPGEILLEEFMEPLGLSLPMRARKALAELLRVSARLPTSSNVLQGHNRMALICRLTVTALCFRFPCGCQV